MIRLSSTDLDLLAAAAAAPGSARDIARRVAGAAPIQVWRLREMGYLRHTEAGLVLTDDGSALLAAERGDAA